MTTQNMEYSTTTLFLKPRNNTADFAESLLEDNNIHVKDEAVAFLNDDVKHEETSTNEVDNQREDKNNPVHAGFFGDDEPSQGYNITGSNRTSPQDSSIDQASWDLQAQEDELRELGIDVVDQVSLERHVEAAVDKAVATHARKQKLQILKREIKDVKMESKSAENKMLALKNRLSELLRGGIQMQLSLGGDAVGAGLQSTSHPVVSEELGVTTEGRETPDSAGGMGVSPLQVYQRIGTGCLSARSRLSHGECCDCYFS
ncbi:hypothetical protein E2C01_050328 [Portunus trituberculatus]|uniref:Uncharacterized protein n=1 Tax=Portunus trituberculatus TaxID=210409 RepID=A0A5B7GFT5_PORTR|nr:hypothetical protein [Portunus trituberculatus]